MNCFVGEVTQEQCHKQDYKPVPKELISLSDLSEDQQTLLKLRVSPEIKNICHYHKCKYLDKFSHIYARKCCDPFRIHKNPVRKGLRKILTEHLSKPTNTPVSLIPGKALCSSCRSKIFTKDDCFENQNNQDDEFIPNAHEVIGDITLQQVSSVCETLDLSPICKLIKLNKGQRHSALHKKAETIACTVKRKLEVSFSDKFE